MTSVMKKTSEYRAHARECRTLASRMDRGNDRELLLQMASDWDRLARDRADLLRRHPELDRANAETEEPVKTSGAPGGGKRAKARCDQVESPDR